MTPLERRLLGLLPPVVRCGDAARGGRLLAGEEHGSYVADEDAAGSPPSSSSPSSPSDVSPSAVSSPSPSSSDVSSLPPLAEASELPLVDASALDAVWAQRLERPALDEVPVLGAVLEALGTADRAMVQVVVGLAELMASGETEARTGVSVEVWVALVARQTRMDRRTLLRAARMLVRFPALRAGVVAGRVSFPQLRSVTMALRQAPRALDGEVDALLGRLVAQLADADPDVLAEQVRAAVEEWQASALPPTVEEGTDRSWLSLQPHLDGTGGRVSGELDAVGFALLDAATAPSRGQLDHPGGAGGARAANLLARLADPDTTDPDVPAGMPRPRLVVRTTLDTLLDVDRVPVRLLTTLTGGQVTTTATTARRLVDEAGADLRLVLVGDDGVPLGVGRRTRIPPGWMSDVLAAVHDTCTGPLCGHAARGAETDHARPWSPTGDEPGGATDIGNLGPLCAATNRRKEADGWRADQHPDGRRHWTHPRTGLAVTTVPATWRPRNLDRAPDPGPGHTPSGLTAAPHRCDATSPGRPRAGPARDGPRPAHGDAARDGPGRDGAPESSPAARDPDDDVPF